MTNQAFQGCFNYMRIILHGGAQHSRPEAATPRPNASARIRQKLHDGEKVQNTNKTKQAYNTAAVITTRSTFKIEDPPLGPGRVE